MDAVVMLSDFEKSPENRVASELHPVAALASSAATANLITDFPNFGELFIRMTRPTDTQPS
jgi:hypothetical protein